VTPFCTRKRLPIDVELATCAASAHGTAVTLRGLRAGFAVPDPKKLRQVLLHEYGRATDFRIAINGKPPGVDDVDSCAAASVRPRFDLEPDNRKVLALGSGFWCDKER
jgi:hypothetical protein